ncbi:hypothetical protein Hdeb2414_s0032g00711681 [Helianthus debilis subsp. tardiflorus]
MLEWAGSHEGGYVRTKGFIRSRALVHTRQENHDLSYKLEQSQIQEHLKMQDECSTSYAGINELDSQTENLHNELKLKSKELSESTLAVKELETQIKNLEEEIGKQADGFEADMEELIRVKVEQEQRTIHAEDNLRKKNFKTLILLANFKRNSENYQ